MRNSVEVVDSEIEIIEDAEEDSHNYLKRLLLRLWGDLSLRAVLCNISVSKT